MACWVRLSVVAGQAVSGGQALAAAAAAAPAAAVTGGGQGRPLLLEVRAHAVPHTVPHAVPMLACSQR